MSENKDIRWVQRFSNYKKALSKLSEAISYINKNRKEENTILDEIIKEGLIQRFEYTYEIAWNVMKDFAFYQGNSNITGSRDAIRFAFSSGLIKNGSVWMEMIVSRIKTSHTYDEAIANAIFNKVITEYYNEFVAFKETMHQKSLDI